MKGHHIRRISALLSAIALLANAPAALALIPEGDYIEVSPTPDKGARTYHGMYDKPVTVEGNEVTVTRDMTYTYKEGLPNTAVEAKGDVVVNTQDVSVICESTDPVTAARASSGAEIDIGGTVSVVADQGLEATGVGVTDGSITISGDGEDTDAINVDSAHGQLAVAIKFTAAESGTSGSVIVENGSVAVNACRSATGVNAVHSDDPEQPDGTAVITIVNGDLNVDSVSDAYGIKAESMEQLEVSANSINVCGGSVSGSGLIGILAGLSDVTAIGDLNVNVDPAASSDETIAVGILTLQADVTVDGSVTVNGGAAAAFAVNDMGGSDILITGDAETDGEHAILVQPIEDLGGSTVAILGELKGGDIAVSSTDGMQFILGSATLNEDGTSPIVMVDEEGAPVELTEEQQAQLNELVYYIVGSEDAQITIDGTEAYVARNGETYQIASLGSTITVTPVQTGKTIESVKLYSDAAQTVQIETIMNADGSCTLLWPSDRVDLRTISAVLTYLKETDPDRKVTVKTVPAKDSVGDTVRFGGVDWIITDIDEETGLYTLASVASFTEEQLQDLQRLLDELLTDAELTYVQKDEAQLPIVSLITEEVAEQYFGGRTDHLCIVTDPAFPRD